MTSARNISMPFLAAALLLALGCSAVVALVPVHAESGHMREGFVYFPSAPYDTREFSLRVGVRTDANCRNANVIEIAYLLRG